LTALRTKSTGASPKDMPKVQIVKILKDGFWVALLNPKTAIFFAAFLPQFLETSASTMSQSVALGAAFVLIAMCTDTAYVLAASTVSPALGRITRGAALGRYLTASVFIGLGLLTAFSGNRASK
jgi:threonine/homoserine/homoserine lactone efflux protein